jgi:hypothetical protein
MMGVPLQCCTLLVKDVKRGAADEGVLKRCNATKVVACCAAAPLRRCAAAPLRRCAAAPLRRCAGVPYELVH